MRLVILLAVALAVSAVQCAASCVSDDCAAKSEPCHHHDSPKQAKCAREIPAAKAPTIVCHAALPPATIFVTFTAGNRRSARVVIPDGIASPPYINLRI